MTRPQEAMIVGGPRDGEIVPYYGPQMLEPVPPRLRWEPMEVPPPRDIQVRRYQLYQWSDRRVVNGWRYVLSDMAEGLGAE